VETGLSSDPPMNWMCSFLDKYNLISNSDAHSPEKLGREANIFNTDLSYDSIINALKSKDHECFLGTIEFFPQEGKYHYDGHRKCGVMWDPLETLKHDAQCPVCGKKVTVGVMNRVAQLSDRKQLPQNNNRVSFHSLIPLKEILSEIFEVGLSSKQIAQNYNSLIQKLGSEFNILLHLSIADIQDATNELLAEAIRRMRNREVHISEGFDGEYGTIKVFHEKEQKSFYPQSNLFGDSVRETFTSYNTSRKLINFDLQQYRQLLHRLQTQAPQTGEIGKKDLKKSEMNWMTELNMEQRSAVQHHYGPALIMAGPGTGKTRVLTSRIANLILNHGVTPATILAVSFTNKAAHEMKERFLNLIGEHKDASMVQVCTFHAFGYSIVKKHISKTGRKIPFSIIDENEREHILYKHLKCDKGQLKTLSAEITDIKQKAIYDTDMPADMDLNTFNSYENFLHQNNLFDLDDLIYRAVKLLNEYPEILSYYTEKYQWISVDEYQDINQAQYQLIRKLMPQTASNICVIGDPNQAIYGFRGANVLFIRNFIQDYPAAVVYELKTSYRCSDFILKASTGIIDEEAISAVSLLQGLEEGVKINISEHNSDKSEAEFIARTIERMMGGLRFFSMDSSISEGNEIGEIQSLADFVILCRIGKQMKVVEKALNDHSIPYQTVADSPLFKQEPIISLLDIIRYVANKNQYIKRHLIDKRVLSENDFNQLDNLMPENSVAALTEKIIDTYFCKEKSACKAQFNELLSIAGYFEDDIDEFLKYIALGTEIDNYKPNIECVSLMTLHAAKGLEFKCVFITGCEDGLIPYSLYANQKSEIDEERRLLYVGMTRAKKYLYLSHAKKRFLLGREYHLNRSPFLNGIEKDLIELAKGEYKRKEKREDNQLSLF
jgi:superfamily I DNA/RNA helicase